MVDSEDGRQVPVVQAYAFGKYLGFLKVTFDSNGNVLKYSGIKLSLFKHAMHNTILPIVTNHDQFQSGLKKKRRGIKSSVAISMEQEIVLLPVGRKGEGKMER